MFVPLLFLTCLQDSASTLLQMSFVHVGSSLQPVKIILNFNPVTQPVSDPVPLCVTWKYDELDAYIFMWVTDKTSRVQDWVTGSKTSRRQDINPITIIPLLAQWVTSCESSKQGHHAAHFSSLYRQGLYDKLLHVLIMQKAASSAVP